MCVCVCVQLLTACSLMPPNTNEGKDLTNILSGLTSILKAALT